MESNLICSSPNYCSRSQAAMSNMSLVPALQRSQRAAAELADRISYHCSTPSCGFNGLAVDHTMQTKWNPCVFVLRARFVMIPKIVSYDLRSCDCFVCGAVASAHCGSCSCRFVSYDLRSYDCLVACVVAFCPL